MECVNILRKKIRLYRAKHVKTKDFTFMSWIHNGIQVLTAGMGADICATRVLNIERNTFLLSPDPIGNPWYWYYSFGFVACLTISCFGLWDIYTFGVQNMNKLQVLDGV